MYDETKKTNFCPWRNTTKRSKLMGKYAVVVNWISLRSFLLIASIHQLHIRSINVLLAFY